MTNIQFLKMHGLGNDFVIIDNRKHMLNLSASQIRGLSNRKRGIGCDQLITMEISKTNADIKMRIYNSDGSEVGACGNAARCIGRLMMDEKNNTQVQIEAMDRVLLATRSNELISVNMGQAAIDWRDIPLSQKMDTISLEINEGILENPVAVNVGNPHMVFFVKNINEIDLGSIGPKLEHHSFFPKKANIEIAQIISSEKIRVKVWERGAGITEACGSGACAVLVAAVRRNLSDRRAEIELDGGALEIEWQRDNCVSMTGPTEINFSGSFSL